MIMPFFCISIQTTTDNPKVRRIIARKTLNET